MDCSKIKVVKKDGTKEEFNVKKVLAAISKSAERAMITFLPTSSFIDKANAAGIVRIKLIPVPTTVYLSEFQ